MTQHQGDLALVRTACMKYLLSLVSFWTCWSALRFAKLNGRHTPVVATTALAASSAFAPSDALPVGGAPSRAGVGGVGEPALAARRRLGHACAPVLASPPVGVD